MEYLNKGKYYGIPNKVLSYKDIVITDNEYIHSRVDWHYHENAYFTYLLQGSLQEINKKETFNCAPGTLLFHNCQEAHFNIKPEGYTRGFQVEFSNEWLNNHGFTSGHFEGSLMVDNAALKTIFNNIYIESVYHDRFSELTIETLLLQFFAEMMRSSGNESNKLPVWLKTIESILNDENDSNITLEYLSAQTGVHPVHISRIFPKYYGVTMGTYIRRLRVNKSVKLIMKSGLSLTQIGAACGFSDQSHFIRVFKSFCNITPLMFKRTLK